LQKQDTIEIDRLKREKNNLEYEVSRSKSNVDTERRRCEKLEREMGAANDKSEKAQRELHKCNCTSTHHKMNKIFLSATL